MPNSLKRFFWSCSEMPTPSSLTMNSMNWLWGLHQHLILPLSVNFKAFEKRLSKIYLIHFQSLLISISSTSSFLKFIILNERLIPFPLAWISNISQISEKSCLMLNSLKDKLSMFLSIFELSRMSSIKESRSSTLTKMISMYFRRS